MSLSSQRLKKSRALRIALGASLSIGASAAFIFAIAAAPQAQQATPRGPQGFISGTVESSKGREAGVWVIAETSELPTKFAKIVVTAPDGRFVLPELPNASYNVWVRGYGLADSKPVPGKPGQTLALKAELAKTPAEAAKIYPANYWYSLIDVPPASEFPGKGADVNGIPTTFKTRSQYIDQIKQGCQLCHQLGNQLTRSLDHMKGLGLKDSVEMWQYRTKTGQRGSEMDNMIRRMGPRAYKMFADWTDRIAAGELPPAPPRPTGVEANTVVTMWDFGDSTTFAHDEVTTSKQNPRVNGYGPTWAVDAGHGNWIGVDPIENAALEIKIPTRDDPATMHSRFPRTMPKPSNFWGEEVVHAGVSDPHNGMFDNQGRMWATSTVTQVLPAWCKDPANKFNAYFPTRNGGNRNASVYDPKTQKWELIYTCYGTHHLQFNDKQDKLFFSGGGPTIPWVDVKVWDQTHDEKQSVGWCPTVLDTNGDGKITKPWNEPVGIQRNQEEGGGGLALGVIDPKLDTRVDAGSYGVISSPTDDSIWAAGTAFPGRFTRLELGSNPPETCKAEIYTVPENMQDLHFGPRGIDIDRNGVVWSATSGSGGFVSFDRRKCKVFSGIGVVEGKQCAEGWTFYPLTKGPDMKNAPGINADFHYYNWVDQFNTSGMGANTPIATGSTSDSLILLNPSTKQFTQLRVPYPLGFFMRGLDGRIDDPNGGWKGRGLWAIYGTNYVWHIEGGKGTRPKMVHLQIRPDPLAR